MRDSFNTSSIISRIYMYKDARGLKNLFFDSRHSFLPLSLPILLIPVLNTTWKIACKLCDNFRCGKKDVRYRLFRSIFM